MSCLSTWNPSSEANHGKDRAILKSINIPGNNRLIDTPGAFVVRQVYKGTFLNDGGIEQYFRVI